MVLLLLMGMVSAPPWGADIRTSPPSPPRLELQGAEPAGTVVWVKRKLKLTVQGPGPLVLDFYGLQTTRGRKTSGPGKVLVKHTPRAGKKRQHKLALPARALAGASIEGRAWTLTEPRSLTLELGPGKHVLVITTQGAPTGVAVVARQQSPSEPALAALDPELPEPELPEPELPDPAPSEPDLPEPDLAEPDLPGPTLADGEPALPGLDDEPSLVSTAGAPAAGPFFEVIGEADTVDVVEPDAVIVFNRVALNRSLQVRATGPGTMVLDVHTYREPGPPPSDEPVSVSVSLDGKPLQTRGIPHTSDDRYQLLGTSHALSERVALRVTLPAGEHDVAVSVSDPLVLGALVRPRTDSSIDPPREERPPVVVTVTAPSAPEPESFSRLGLFGGGVLVMALGTPGYTAGIAGDYGFTLGRQRFGVGASASIARVEVQRAVRDPRLDPNPVGVSTLLTMIPAVAVVRWSYSFTEWLDFTLGVGGGAWVGWLQTQAPGVDRMSRTQFAAVGHAEASLLFRIALGGVALRFAYQPATEVRTQYISAFSPSTLSLSAGWMFEL